MTVAAGHSHTLPIGWAGKALSLILLSHKLCVHVLEYKSGWIPLGLPFCMTVNSKFFL